MFRTFLIRSLAAALCGLCLAVPGRAAQIDCNGDYCFSDADFSAQEGLTGICITHLPEAQTGTLLLGSRAIQAGDILTAQQAAQLIFTPGSTVADRTASVEYLPIFADHVDCRTTMTFHIRGKEDKAPIAEDSAAETYKNLPNTGKLKVSDPEGQAMTYTVTRQPKRGTVTISEDGSFTYTPKKNKVGIDSFTYTATDPAGNVSREATVTVTILKPSTAAAYTDTAGRDCRFAAEWMKHTGIFVGESLGDQSCFQPEKPVTRGEFVTMLVKTLEIPTDEYLTYTGYLDEIPTWLQPYLASAIRSGLTAGLPNQETFGANVEITGAEAAVMLQNGLNLSAAQNVIAQEDVPDWASAALQAVRQQGIAVNAQQPLTREQTAQILYQCAKLHSAEPDTLV